MGVQLGFPRMEMIPFIDGDFNLDNGKKLVITRHQLDTEDEVVSEINAETGTLIRGSGGKEIYSNPNEESGIINFSTVNAGVGDDKAFDERLKDFLFPTQEVFVSGSDQYRAIYDIPGIVLSAWPNMFKFIIKPTAPDGTIAPESDWRVFPRCIAIPNPYRAQYGSTPGKTDVQIISVGGFFIGKQATAVGDIDLSVNKDLSAGGTDKFLSVSLDGTVYNVNLGKDGATTSNMILTALNVAFGNSRANLDVNNFLQIKGFQFGDGSFNNEGVVIVTDGVPDSAYALVYATLTAAPDTHNGEAAQLIEVLGEGVESAKP